MAFNSDWENLAVVGRGGSSTVYKAVLKPSGKFVAVKQIDIDGLSRDQINGIKGEIETMKDLSHPNILCYLGTQQSPNRVFIFLEYADRGSLRQYYQNNGPLAEPQISYCLQGIVAGLNYLHSNGIAHRDIKCANCLLCSDGVVKLADFGASKRFEMDSIVSGLKGTPHWMAPEVIKGTQMTTGWIKADVWSLGCAVVEMFTAKVPYAEYENPMTAMYKIASGEIPSLKPSSVQPNVASDALVSFIHACCAVDPTARPGADELLIHPFVAEKVDNIGALFEEVAVIPAPAAPVEQTSSYDEEHSPDFRATADNLNVDATEQGVRNSATIIATHRAAPAEFPAGTRSRADSLCSLMSGDDETTVANGAEVSYTDDDFCSYGSTGQSDLSAQAQRQEQACNVRNYNASGAATPIATVGMGVGIGESEELSQTGDSAVAGEVRSGRTLIGGPPSGVRTSSRSRSRGHSRPIAINTATASTGDLESSTGGMDDLLTPALHKGPVRGASVQLQMMPMLGQQVRELTLSDRVDSTKTPALTRKWSDTAFLDVSQDKKNEAPLPYDSSLRQDTPQSAQSVATPVSTLISSKTSASSAGDAGNAASSGVPQSFAVPTFDDASQVYKSMMMKYSPRANESTQQSRGFQMSEEELADAVNAAWAAQENDDSGDEGAVSGTESALSGGKVEEAVAVSAQVLSATSQQVHSSPLLTSTPQLISMTVGANDQDTIAESHGSAPAQQIYRESSQKVEPLRELKPIVRENAKYNKAKAPVQLDNVVVPASFGGNGNINFPPGKLAAPLNDNIDRPYAPLSGEKLRLHSFADPQKASNVPGGPSGGAVSSAEALDRLSNSGAAAVRKIAAQELREVSDRRNLLGTHGHNHTHGHSTTSANMSDNVQRVKGQSKGKGTVVHHTTKALKRAHNQISPRSHHTSQAQGITSHQQLMQGQLHNNQLPAERVVGPVGGVRSQSAGVNLSCEGGGHAHSNRKDARQKLPPVLRGMLRGGASSSSGSIAPIEEGRTLRTESGDGAGLGVPLHLMDPGAGPIGRYIQSAPAVSRSLNLPPIDGANRHGHRQGASIDSSTGTNIAGGEGSALLTSHTPKTKQPRAHRFGRPSVGSNGVSEILQQSFANAMKGYAHDEGTHE